MEEWTDAYLSTLEWHLSAVSNRLNSHGSTSNSPSPKSRPDPSSESAPLQPCPHCLFQVTRSTPWTPMSTACKEDSIFQAEERTRHAFESTYTKEQRKFNKMRQRGHTKCPECSTHDNIQTGYGCSSSTLSSDNGHACYLWTANTQSSQNQSNCSKQCQGKA